MTKPDAVPYVALLAASLLAGCDFTTDKVTEVLACTLDSCRVLVNGDYRATSRAPVALGDCLGGIKGDYNRTPIPCPKERP